MNAQALAALAVQLLQPKLAQTARGGADPAFTVQDDAFLKALKQARHILHLATDPPEDVVHAYQLFRIDDVMSFSELSEVFETAEWGNLKSVHTVASCVSLILDHAFGYVERSGQRVELTRAGLDFEYIKIHGGKVLMEFLLATRLDIVFENDSDALIAAVLNAVTQEAIGRLDGIREGSDEPRIIDANFINRVCVGWHYSGRENASKSIGVDELHGIILTFYTLGGDVDGDVREEECKHIAAKTTSLRDWLGSFSNVPSDFKDHLDTCIDAYNSSPPDLAKANGAFRKAFYVLLKTWGKMKLTSFVKTLPKRKILGALQDVPSESYGVREYPFEYGLESDDRHLEDQMAWQWEVMDQRRNFKTRSDNLKDWLDGGVPSPISLYMDDRSYDHMYDYMATSDFQVNEAYHKYLVRSEWLIMEMADSMRHVDASPALDELERLLGVVWERLKGEIDQCYRRAGQDDENHLEYGKLTMAKIVNPPASRQIRPYPLFLYAALLGLDRKRLLVKESKMKANSIRSSQHPEGEPVPSGIMSTPISLRDAPRTAD